MPVKTTFVTEQYIRDAGLPNHGKTYAVIPHGYIIDETRTQLHQAGLEIERELYKTTMDGQIAQGIYHLKHAQDPEMGLMFAWSNSYNKQMRFKCAIGGYVFICLNGVVNGNLGAYNRKHTGSARYDVVCSIKEQIGNAKTYYDGLIADKEMLKQVTLNKTQKAKMIGQLFLEHEILTLTQVGMIEREIKKPSFNYSANQDSAWDLYNHVTLALKDSHPQQYLSDHQKLHNFFVDEFGTLKSTTPRVLEQLEINFEEEEEEVVEQAEPEMSGYGVMFM